MFDFYFFVKQIQLLQKQNKFDRKILIIFGSKMYFVNPHYQSPKLTNDQKTKKANEILLILSISKYDRKNQDKKKVYEYFIQNPYLIEIQRAKSLKARILCVAQIELLTVYQYERHLKKKQKQNHKKQNNQQKHPYSQAKQNQYIILEEFKLTEKLAVIINETKQQIMRQDESPIKNKMEKMREYSLLSHFAYHQILYLAHFFQKVSDIAYKHFLFKQNQKSDYVYFIQQGQFQVFKDIHLQKQKSLTKLNKIKSKSSLQNTFQVIDQNTFKKKQIKIKKEEISRLAGGYGQSFGEMEFFIQSQTRFYSLKSNSSISSAYRIHFKHFNEIFKIELNRFNRLKKQYIFKFKNDQQKLNSNQKLKNKLSLTQKRSSFEQRQSSSENNKVSSIIFQMENQNSTLNSHVEGSFTLPNNSSTIFVNQSNAAKNLARSRKLYSQNAKKSKSHRYGPGFNSQMSDLSKKNSKKNQNHKLQSENSFFPVISKTSTQKKLSQNTKLPLIMKKVNKHNKIKGLMDISTIVSQKQELLNGIINFQNPQFSFYKLDEKNAKKLNFRRAQMQKVNDQESSLAHSQNFIKSLVKRSLKKSGYLVENKAGQNGNVSNQILNRMRTQSINTGSFSVLEHTKEYGLQIPPIQNLKMSKQVRGFLTSNGFDKFFYKI